MANVTLSPKTPLDGLDLTEGGNTIRERTDLALVSLAMPRGGEAALAGALQAHWGLGLPTAVKSATAGELRLISMTADQMMLIGTGDGTVFHQEVAAKLGALAYSTNQTDAWVCLEVRGPDTLPALERICPIDLAPDVFPVGAFARTTMEHLGALIIRLGADHFQLCSASSSAGSFAEAIIVSYENVIS
ncbi:MAG: sarcosine oxidase subunit gamma family protein [Pseudomonadota bacterium]